MDVRKVHREIVSDYESYIRSFLSISDKQIRDKVDSDLSQGKLWPAPLLQFNPTFEMFGEVSKLVDAQGLHPHLADVFKGYSIYRHQAEAIALGTAHRDFIVTSGTGSGKSLTYIATIFDDLLKSPAAPGVRAVIVYPMNALINSQKDEIDRYKNNYEKATGSAFPISYGQYTGQEDDAKRKAMRESPPQILLTNYMMLELLLTRTTERGIRDAIYSNLQFLVFDELHTYRGRQGADIGLLIRRIQAQCARRLTCVGTSATMSSEGTVQAQKEKIASVAKDLFGRAFAPEQIVSESLATSLGSANSTPTSSELALAMQTTINKAASFDELRNHPIAMWLERSVALRAEDGHWLRGKPQTIAEIVDELSVASGMSEELASSTLDDALVWISNVNTALQRSGRRYTVLPFKLHQFISQTGSVYTTLDQDAERFITLEPGIYKPGDPSKKPLFPNVFSRTSGHAFICVSRFGSQLEPREFRQHSGDEEDASTDGYLIVGDDIWDEGDDLGFLPDSWLNRAKTAPTKEKRARFPIKLFFDSSGKCSEAESLPFVGWFMTAPLLFDPTSGVFFDTKTNEGTKLTTLGSEGRSTSTTITTFSILNQLSIASYSARDQKLISFTDNRQDAALQAGHFNDFVDVVRLRSAIALALHSAPDQRLEFQSLGEAVFRALNLGFTEYARLNEPPELAHVRRSYDECFQTYLLYRAIEDLRRSWRIILPNLEQCALLDVQYKDLQLTAADDRYWRDVPILSEIDVPEREEFLATVLDFFRLEFALHSENYLAQNKCRENEKLFREKLRAPWTLEAKENLREPFALRLGNLDRRTKVASKSLGAASGLGKFIRQYAKLKLQLTINRAGYDEFIHALLRKLVGADYLHVQSARGEEGEELPIYRLKIEKLVWCAGNRSTVKADMIKRRSYKDQAPQPNQFFQKLYLRDFSNQKRLQAQDHTGQLGSDERRDREERFRADWYLDDQKQTPDANRINAESISALFCSPTMELGVDIGGLSVVHMRNAPPNPANYAQRAGRAGRSGQGALVFTYCSSYSAHDRHFFKHQVDLVAGVVQAPRLDLCNQELLQTHLNALAISEVGLPGLEAGQGFRPSITRLIDEDQSGLTLKKEVMSGLTLSAPTADRIQATFQRVINDFAPRLKEKSAYWFSDVWVHKTLGDLPANLDRSIDRWRKLYRAARQSLDRATQTIQSGTLTLGSDEYRKAKRVQDQSTRQLDLLRNNAGGSSELSEFYPYRYLASEGFLPGYNFTRLPLRVFLPTSDTSGEFVSRPRALALREFGPMNTIYHSGQKYRVSQLVVQDAESAFTEAKVSVKAGYFLTGNELQRETCPLTGVSLSDAANVQSMHYLIEMSESRAEAVERITCEEEERISRGFNVQTYFSIDAGAGERQRRASLRGNGEPLLNLIYIPAARLVHVNDGWRAQTTEGFPMGMTSGEWRASLPKEEDTNRETYSRVKLWTSNLADALYIVPVQPLGLKPEGVTTLQHALKRAIEQVFQVESSEIGVINIGDPKAPNILLFEAAEGSLGILSQFIDDVEAFHKVIDLATALCRFDDESYTDPASYDDLLSYYNQRDHKVLDRFLIKDALEKLSMCTVELQTNASYASYDDQYESLLRSLDPSSSTERKFIETLQKAGLRLPDAAQKRVDGIYVQPDFFYEPNIWVFCDGTPHDEADVRADDAKKRQAIMARGDEVWVYYYKDNLPEALKKRPDIFKRVR